jgi:hypothetical protein
MTSPSLDDFANGDIDATDIGVLGHMRAVYDALDPVPNGLVDRIQFGITLDALHAEIAQLQRTHDFVGVRADGVTDAQTVTFTSSSLTTMVTITPSGPDHVRVDGWIAPGGGVGVELRIVDDLLRTEADDDGRFVFENVPHGLAQFFLRRAGEQPVVTPSITL